MGQSNFRGPSLVAALVALSALTGCADNLLFGSGGTPPGTGGSGGGGTGGAGSTTAARVDLLLTIDNSRSMADKQAILGLAVPSLVDSLVNPLCVDDDGLPASSQPLDPAADCPTGTTREFPPIRDLHVGVITTSLGDHGGDVCPHTAPTQQNNDFGRLIDRRAGGGEVATYRDLGFLAWDPGGELSPPGESSELALIDQLRDLVTGAGQVGCGYEAQLESWYRFLVDPNPYGSIEESGGAAAMQGTDTIVLEQREDFLRPDSLLVIMMLSDENDCSMREGGQFYFAAKSQAGAGQYHLPRAQVMCEIDPNDPCCRSCGQSDDGCTPKGAECASTHTATTDAFNLRCWDQKRRFGIDFLYPIERYEDALTARQVSDRDGNLEPNPLFSDLDPSDDIDTIRDPALIFVASIQGVPWQDIARQDSTGQPDLVAGRNAAGRQVGGFQSAAELSANQTWSVIVGDPARYHTDASALPSDRLMLEAIAPRTGTHPITGDAIAPPGANTMANPINGHEYAIPNQDDLQYACIFELPEPRDCAAPGADSCDCAVTTTNNPLCQNAQSTYGTTQFRAKAYPGIRQLQLTRALDSRGVVGSICPAQLADPTAMDFGYVPSVRALVEAIGPHLSTPE